MFFMFAFAGINYLAGSIVSNIRKMAGQFNKGESQKKTKKNTDFILSIFDSNKFYILAGILIFINICLYPIMLIKLMSNANIIKDLYAGSILIDLLIIGFILLSASITFLKNRFIIIQSIIFGLTIIDVIITIIGRFIPNNPNLVTQGWYIQLNGWLIILPLLIILLNIIIGIIIRMSIKSIKIKLFNRKSYLTTNTNDNSLKYVFGIDLLTNNVNQNKLNKISKKKNKK